MKYGEEGKAEALRQLTKGAKSWKELHISLWYEYNTSMSKLKIKASEIIALINQKLQTSNRGFRDPATRIISML